MSGKNRNEPIMPMLKALKKGEKAAFRLSRVTSVRTACSILSLQDNLKFKTMSDRENRIVTVERL